MQIQANRQDTCSDISREHVQPNLQHGEVTHGCEWGERAIVARGTAPSLFLSLSLRFCLSWSLSSLFPVLPSPLTFLCPSLHHCPLNSPTTPSVSCPTSFLWVRQEMLWGAWMMMMMMTMMMMSSRCTVFGTTMNLHGNRKWTSSFTSLLLSDFSATVLCHMVHFPNNIH